MNPALPGLAPYFVAEPPSDAFRALVLEDHGADAVIVCCSDDAALVEDSVEAAMLHTMKLYPPINLGGVLIHTITN